MKTVTARHSRPAIYERRLCDPDDILVAPAVELEVAYAEGQEKAALDALDRAYADVKRQVTGMTTLVPGERTED